MLPIKEEEGGGGGGGGGGENWLTKKTKDQTIEWGDFSMTLMSLMSVIQGSDTWGGKRGACSGAACLNQCKIAEVTDTQITSDQWWL